MMIRNLLIVILLADSKIVAFGASGDEVAWARQNRDFVLENFISAR